MTVGEAWLAPSMAGAAVGFAVLAWAAARPSAVRARLLTNAVPAVVGPRGWGRPLAPVGAAAVRAGLVRADRLQERIGPAAAATTVERVAGAKVAGAALTAAAAWLLRPVLAPALAALAFMAPDLLLLRRARRRRAAADAEVPQLLDLLAAASTAGLAAPLALRRAAAVLRGPLGEELRGVDRAVDLGARWREELARCAERVGSADLRRAVAVLARTERLGTPLGQASAELADRVRAARRAAAAERARKAPVKMLFPLVLLILPAFLLLTVVPVLITTVRSIG